VAGPIAKGATASTGSERDRCAAVVERCGLSAERGAGGLEAERRGWPEAARRGPGEALARAGLARGCCRHRSGVALLPRLCGDGLGMGRGAHARWQRWPMVPAVL
jgi:hypothetical protein